MSDQEKKDEILKQIAQLKSSFRSLNKLWNQDPDLCDKTLGEHYPFEKSFDEVSTNVEEWEVTVRAIITAG